MSEIVQRCIKRLNTLSFFLLFRSTTKFGYLCTRLLYTLRIIIVLNIDFYMATSKFEHVFIDCILKTFQTITNFGYVSKVRNVILYAIT